MKVIKFIWAWYTKETHHYHEKVGTFSSEEFRTLSGALEMLKI
jgi:hypothetical protein